MIAVLDEGITVIDREETFLMKEEWEKEVRWRGEEVETPEVSLRSGKLEMLGGVVL